MGKLLHFPQDPLFWRKSFPNTVRAFVPLKKELILEPEYSLYLKQKSDGLWYEYNTVAVMLVRKESR